MSRTKRDVVVLKQIARLLMESLMLKDGIENPMDLPSGILKQLAIVEIEINGLISAISYEGIETSYDGAEASAKTLLTAIDAMYENDRAKWS